MAQFTEARWGIKLGFVAKDSGWGASFNLIGGLLGAMLQPLILSYQQNTPPNSPAEGDTYYVASGGSGAWQGNDGKIAAWQNGAWAFYPARKGLIAFINDKTDIEFYDGSSWHVQTSSGGGSSGGGSVVSGSTIRPDSVIAPDASDASVANARGDTLSLFGGAFASGSTQTQNGGHVVIHGGAGSGVGSFENGIVLLMGGAPGLTVDFLRSRFSDGQNFPVNTNDDNHYRSGGILLLETSISDGTGGAALLQGGSGRENYKGGDLFLAGGYNGGNVHIASGVQQTANAGGNIDIWAWTNDNNRYDGGQITIRTGNVAGPNKPGSISFTAGDQVENGDQSVTAQGGGISFKTGQGGGSGPGGDVTFTLGKRSSGTGRSGLIIVNNCPTSDPHVAGAIWNNNGVLNISAG